MLSSEPLEGCTIRVAQPPQVGSVDLGMPVELPEVAVHQAAIEEEGQSSGQILGHSFATNVKDVEMVLEADEFTRKVRAVDGGNDAPPFLLGSETPHDDVAALVRPQPLSAGVGYADGVRFPHDPRPGYTPILEMPWIEKRHRPLLRLRAQVVLETEIDNGSRGHLNPEIPKARREMGHAINDALFDAIGSDVHEAVGIAVSDH